MRGAVVSNGALLTSATFEMEIFPSQRDESEIIHSGEYTRLENTIAAAREALQIAQDTQNTIDAAEAVRQAQERLREAAERQEKSKRAGERMTPQRRSQNVSRRWRQQSSRQRNV